MSDWLKDHERAKVKRKQTEEDGEVRLGKRRRLDPLTNWGDGGEGEDEGDKREWLLGTIDMIKETGAEMPKLELQSIAVV